MKSMMGDRGRRWAAIAALIGYVATLVLAVLLLSDDLVALLGAWVTVVLATAVAWIAATRTGTRRWGALIVAMALVVGAIAVLVMHSAVLDVLVVVAAWLLATASAHHALRIDRIGLRDARPPGTMVPPAQRAVLLMNPRSGGGKVEQHDLVTHAAQRGIRGVVLQPGDDLETLARDAIASGADVIGMAGGDGSQALVAGIAAEHDVPFVCIPAGTRNHLALDLGVDRDDVVGSLDAFADGYERTIDLASVNGRTFVNNVSFGVYARIVQSDDYRAQKVATAAAMLPELLGPGAEAFDL
ncbi:MAG TPA: diacylglycerol kinase family protein, partial [Acidimicrobiia bacterium]|nr:diacylglycerol kinase family protein [Acidimicrobiia bacterium]